MSETNTGSLDTRLREISEHLKSTVVDPAVKEKNDILENARKEADAIIADARKEADRIVEESRNTAQKEIETMESSLRVAARKAVDALKISLEKEVLSGAVAAPMKETLSDTALMTTFIEEIISHYIKSDTSSVEIALPDGLREDIKNATASRLSGSDGIVISDERVPAGFTVRMVDNNITFDFTAESLTELLSEYLREDLRKWLFA